MNYLKNSFMEKVRGKFGEFNRTNELNVLSEDFMNDSPDNENNILHDLEKRNGNEINLHGEISHNEIDDEQAQLEKEVFGTREDI